MQRDFGLHVVNLFDTGVAARDLGLPRGLGPLLLELCGVHADKELRMTRWDDRPLPLEAVRYARRDTHYLLYIYDRLR